MESLTCGITRKEISLALFARYQCRDIALEFVTHITAVSDGCRSSMTCVLLGYRSSNGHWKLRGAECDDDIARIESVCPLSPSFDFIALAFVIALWKTVMAAMVISPAARFTSQACTSSVSRRRINRCHHATSKRGRLQFVRLCFASAEPR